MTLSTSSAPTTQTPLQREVAELRAELAEREAAHSAAIADLRRQLAEALLDPVTGLPTRRGWEPHAQQRLHVSRTVVALLDLDGFKAVNDSSGHAAGDRVLRTVADRLRARLDAGVVLGRAGGDELVVISHHPVPWELLLRDLSRPIPMPAGDAAEVGASIGVATNAPGTELSTALAHADAAMYEAKRGRLGWVHAQPR